MTNYKNLLLYIHIKYLGRSKYANISKVLKTPQRKLCGPHEGYRHGVDEAHWKFKGGSTYFVTDLTDANINSIVANGIPTLTNSLKTKTRLLKSISDWEIRTLVKMATVKAKKHLESWEIMFSDIMRTSSGNVVDYEFWR